MSRPARALHLDGDWLTVPASAFDHAGFRAWVLSDEFPEKLRATFLDGEVFLEMSPESLESHNKVKQAATVGVVRIVEEGDLGEVYVDGMLLTHEGAGLSAKPDLAFASWASLEVGRLRFVPKADRDDEFVEIVGTPDLVVEVVSDASVRKDLVRLREAYRRAGIPEYWIMDARGDEVGFEILRLESDEYRAAAPSGSPQPSAVLGRTLVLARRRNRAGRWAYRLEAV